MTAGVWRKARWRHLAAQIVIAVLLLTNPLILHMMADPQALLLVAGLGLVFMATRLLPRTGLQQSSVLAGVSLAALYLSSAYSILYMPFLVAGLVIIMPRRHLRQHTAGFFIVLLTPVVLAIASAAYLDFLGTFDRSAAIFDTQDWFADRQPLPGADLWLARFGGHVHTAAASALIWTALIAPLTMFRLVAAWGRAEARHAGYVIAALVLAPAFAAHFALPVSPLVSFGAMLSANIPFLPAIPMRIAVAGLCFASAAGLGAAWLYTS